MNLRLLSGSAGAAAVTSVLAVALLVPSASTAAPAAAAAGPSGHGRAAVGPGWYLTEVEHGPVGDFGVEPTSESIELISPSGARTTVYSRAVPDPAKELTLSGWSADGSTALLSVFRRHGQKLFRLDVASGVLTRIPASLVAGAVLDPAGTGLVVERTLLNDSHSRDGLMRVAWDGTLTSLHAFVDGPILATGNRVVTGGDRPGAHGLRVISLRSGHLLRSRSTSSYCQVVRQWDAGHVLARCGGALSLFATTSGAISVLAPDPAGERAAVEARSAGGTTYVEVADVCDIDSVARLSHGRLHPLHVPGAGQGVALVGTDGSDLVLWHQDNCHSRASTVPPGQLSRFDPSSGTDTPLVTLGAEEDFQRVLGFGDVRAQHP